MGSMTSRPKVPVTNVVQPQYIYVPAPQTYTPSVPSSGSGSGGGSAGGETGPGTGAPATPVTEPETVRSEVRIENLLRRGRGLSGTVLTGCRGLLSLNGNTPQRKTLLGE